MAAIRACRSTRPPASAAATAANTVDLGYNHGFTTGEALLYSNGGGASIGGLTSGPVVAVPTSVGYGAGLDGVTALLAMHASCASGITVVGIDNGFGAACAIARMMQ